MLCRLKYNRSGFFFSSTTFSDGLSLIHGLPFRNSKKYDISLYLSHMMVDRSSCCYFWHSDFCFCSKTIFVTKYRVQSRAICGFFICWIRCFTGRRRKCEILSLIESLSFTYTANVMFKLRISQNRNDKRVSELFLSAG